MNLTNNALRNSLAAAACTAMLLATGCDDGSPAAENATSEATVQSNSVESASAPAAVKTETKIIVREVEVEREPSCANCGEVVAITAVKVDGKSTGGGAVIGAVVGGVIGHQFGSGSGNDAATAGGAIGGGIAGNEIEKNVNATTEYDVTVALEDGGTRTVRMSQTGSVNVGDRVRVAGNTVIEID